MIPGIMAGAAVASAVGPSPLPVLPFNSNITHWFRSDVETFADAIGTPASPGQGVHTWKNQGSQADDAIQPLIGSRPLLGTGGLNGRPFINCPDGDARFFDDLALSHGTGITSIPAWRSFAFVLEGWNLTKTNTPITGGSANIGSKFETYLRPSAGNVRFFKSAVAMGPIASPMIVITSVSAVSTFRLSMNGVFQQLGISGNANSSDSSSMSFLRSPWTALGNQYYDGRIYEAIMWGNDTILSETDMADIANALNSIYNIF